NPGDLAFGNVANYTISGAVAPNNMVAGRFNSDNSLDLAITDGTADSSNNYNVFFLANNGDGTFASSTAKVVGTTSPSGVVAASAIATIRANNDNLDDLVIGGASQLGTMLNTSNGTAISFATPVTYAVTGVTSIAAGVVRTNPTGTNPVQDFVVTTTSNSGSLVAFLNDEVASPNPPTFTVTGPVAAGVSNPTALTLTDLTKDNKPELVYVNNVASGGLVSLPHLQTGKVA